MSRLLSAPTLATEAQRLRPPAPVLDDATRELLARAEAAAFERGRAEGEAAAHREVGAAIDRVTAALGQALLQARAELLELEARRADDLVRAAAQLAVAVVGAEPAGDGRLLLERAREALGQLDHGPFTVEVSAADAALVDAASLDLGDGSQVVAAPGLRAGEARIRGPWSQADLTHDAVVHLAAEALAAQRRAAAAGDGLGVHGGGGHG